MYQVIIEKSINPIKEIQNMSNLFKFWKWPSIIRGIFRKAEPADPLTVAPEDADGSEPDGTGHRSRLSEILKPRGLEQYQRLSAHSMNIVMTHVFILLIIVGICLGCMMISSILGLGVIVGFATLIAVSCAISLPVTTVKEGYAKFVMLFGRPVSLLWAYSGRAEVIDIDDPTRSGSILRLEELYVSDNVFTGDKLVALMLNEATSNEDPPQGQPTAADFLEGRSPIFYKRRKMTRKPRLQIPVSTKDGSKLLERNQVFYLYEGNELTLEAIIKKIEDHEAGFPDDFLQTVQGDFYYKEGSQQIEIPLTNVIDEEIIREKVQAYIARIDSSINRLFGGLFLVGLWPFFRVHTYHFIWSSMLATGNLDENDEDELDQVFLGDEIYGAVMKKVETTDLQTEVIVLAKGRIVNPYHALFSAQKWLEIVLALVRTVFRTVVGGLSFKELRVSKASISQSLNSVVMTKLCDPKGDDIRRRYGFDPYAIEMADIQPEGEDVAKALSAIFVAEQQALARRKAGKGEGDFLVEKARGEAEAIKMVAETFKQYGDFGVVLRYMQALEEASKGGKLVLLGSNIQHLVEGLGLGSKLLAGKEGSSS